MFDHVYVNYLAVSIPKCDELTIPVLEAKVSAHRYFGSAFSMAFTWSGKEWPGNGTQFVLGKAG